MEVLFLFTNFDQLIQLVQRLVVVIILKIFEEIFCFLLNHRYIYIELIFYVLVKHIRTQVWKGFEIEKISKFAKWLMEIKQSSFFSFLKNKQSKITYRWKWKKHLHIRKVKTWKCTPKLYYNRYTWYLPINR